MPRLALNGGEPVRARPFPAYNPIGKEEKEAVMEVLDGAELSGFVGTWSKEFFGGPRVRRLEHDWTTHFGIQHAVSMNSATSGLYAAVGAAGAGPGDEVIVSPYTMTASATAALVYGSIPVFADIDPETFCITPESIRECITPRTRAIIVVDLFGHPAEMDEIMEIAHEHGITVIEDAAQAPGAMYKGRFAGTLADMGVYSLNYHKAIHCGEGGLVVTDDDGFAERLQLIRNHAEVVVKDKGVKNIVNMIGYNFRMTEIEAAIATEQLKKLDRLVESRIHAADYLRGHMADLHGIIPPHVRPRVRHGYYLFPIRYSAAEVGIPREKFVAAMNAEGIPLLNGYVEPIYLEPCYQQRIAFGKDGFPFTYPGYKGTVHYEPGLCPVAERMYYRELMYTNICRAGVTDRDLDDFISALEKVAENIGEVQ
jgi:perosamine synthetase